MYQPVWELILIAIGTHISVVGYIKNSSRFPKCASFGLILNWLVGNLWGIIRECFHIETRKFNKKGTKLFLLRKNFS